MMTTEVVILLTVYTTILMGVVILGPQSTFDEAGPFLGSLIERDVATGRNFGQNGVFPVQWVEPN
ncbi:MAG: hypothetical protein CL677_03930 [Bdellovibrionaceae bacterium]|nr:hypothetical protein [Pseudobdellovibrionaceae bacterium]|tara:strand:+ start:265 stop:459 length:195 start_codon:yes stop_codon:yes gene_type:complete